MVRNDRVCWQYFLNKNVNFSWVYVGTKEVIVWQICQSWHPINLGFVLDTFCEIKMSTICQSWQQPEIIENIMIPISTKTTELGTDSVILIKYKARTYNTEKKTSAYQKKSNRWCQQLDKLLLFLHISLRYLLLC